MQSGNPSKDRGEKLATGAFLGWVLALLVFDLLTLRCFPVPWIDEINYAFQGISAALHQDTALQGAGDLSYYTQNSPAYNLLQVPWLSLFGANAAAVRSLNCVLAAFVMASCWFAVKRLGFIASPRIRFATLAALSLCYPVSYCVRCGRPDVVGMLVFSVSALFWTCPRKSAACTGLFLCALLIPFAGLQYAFYMPILLGAIFWASGKPAVGRLVAIICGGLAGAILLWVYHQHYGGWEGLFTNMTEVRTRRPSGILSNILALLDKLVFRFYLERPHFLLLILASVLLATMWKRLAPSSRGELLFGLLMLFAPGIVIGFFAHFDMPYHWLAVAPSTILLASAASKSWGNFGKALKSGFGILALGLAVSGRIVFVMLGSYLDVASYTLQAEKGAEALVRPGEVVYGDYQIYYALKPRAKSVYLYYVVPRLTKEEKESVTVAFLPSSKDGPGWLSENLGGNWSHEADLPAPKQIPFFKKQLGSFSTGYFYGTQLSVYRREGNANKVEAPAGPAPNVVQ